MGIRLFHRQQKKSREYWTISFLVFGAIIFAALAIGRGSSRDTHEAILTSLRAVDVDHASLQRDVLQSRAGLLRNYDPLVDSIVNLHRTVIKLQQLFSKNGTDDDVGLNMLLASLSASIDRDETLVEEFKTRNALLQNSLAIFNQVLSDVHNSPYQETQRALASSNDLGNMMMRFAAQPIDETAQKIRYQLDGLMRSNANAVPDLTTLTTHGRMILVTLPLVDETISLIQASDTPEQAQILQQQYLEVYGHMSARAAWSRVFLGSMSIILCGYIIILFYRLQAQTRRLTRRLDFEALVSSIKARFDEEDDSFSRALEDAVGLVAEFFAAGKHRLVFMNVHTGEVECEFGSPRTLLLDRMEEEFIAQLPTWTVDEETGGRRFFYRNLQRIGGPAFTGKAVSAGAAVATDICHKSAALLVLEYHEVRVKPNCDDIRFLRGALEVMMSCVENHLSRKAREQLEARLEHSQRLEAVGTLAGGIAHEFNNILGAMLGYGEMALQVMRRTSQTRRYVEEIVSSGERAKYIIDQILTFARKRERVCKPFSIAEAISDILPLLKVSLANEVELTTDLPNKALSVVGNPIEIQQVIMNLCKNAAQASERMPCVAIKARYVERKQKTMLSHGELMPGHYALLSVSDNGSGIPANVLPHIFEPFFTTKSNSGGTGLGLTAVHGNVVGMGGKIDVESRVNVGTQFNLYFPLSHLEPISLKQFFDEQSVPLGSGQTVLVLEKEATLRLMYEEKIAALGYEPLGFASLQGLMDWMRNNGNTADLLVIDVASATEGCAGRNLKVDWPVPLLLITDKSTERWIDGRSLRNMRVLRKPVSSISLASAMALELKMQAEPV